MIQTKLIRYKNIVL